ncbi:MAG: dual specificity protein phosphatase family protein [Promethearchaeota archaeon]
MHNFGWIIPGVLAGADQPNSLQDIQRLANAGVLVLVTVMLERLDEDAIRAAGLEYHHIPVRDFGTPTVDQLNEFVKLVEKNRVQGRPVAVHCFMGLGRTGTFLAAYLISQGLTAEEAILEVRQKRPYSIETHGQEQVLEQFAQQKRS